MEGVITISSDDEDQNRVHRLSLHEAMGEVYKWFLLKKPKVKEIWKRSQGFLVFRRSEKARR